jgi:hypothetical protein
MMILQADSYRPVDVDHKTVTKQRAKDPRHAVEICPRLFLNHFATHDYRIPRNAAQRSIIIAEPTITVRTTVPPMTTILAAHTSQRDS